MRGGRRNVKNKKNDGRGFDHSFNDIARCLWFNLIRQDQLNRKINRVTSGSGMKIPKRTTVQILLLRTAAHIITEAATTALKNS